MLSYLWPQFEFFLVKTTQFWLITLWNYGCNRSVTSCVQTVPTPKRSLILLRKSHKVWRLYLEFSFCKKRKSTRTLCFPSLRPKEKKTAPFGPVMIPYNKCFLLSATLKEVLTIYGCQQWLLAIALIAVISGLTCKREERVNSALYRLQNSRIFCERERRTIFERKVWNEWKDGD